MNEMDQQVPVIELEDAAGKSIPEGSLMEQPEDPEQPEEKPAAAAARTAPQPKVTLQSTGTEDKDSLRNKLIGAGCGIVLGVLLLTVGFWKTLLLGGLGCLGAYLFGVSDKQQSLKEFINRVFPPKD